MNNLLLITGPQGSGKTKLVRLMRNAKEIEANGIANGIILREIWHEKDFKETIVVTATSANYILRRTLENCANELKCSYTHIQL
jgi:nucleoside-triphosphatase THEP1